MAYEIWLTKEQMQRHIAEICPTDTPPLPKPGKVLFLSPPRASGLRPWKITKSNFKGTDGRLLYRGEIIEA